MKLRFTRTKKVSFLYFQRRQIYLVAGKDAAVKQGAAQQFIVSAAGGDMAVIEHQDLVGPTNL